MRPPVRIRWVTVVFISVLFTNLCSYPQEQLLKPGEITVEFNANVTNSEAVWILRSYKITYHLVDRDLYGLNIRADDSKTLTTTTKALIDAFNSGEFGQSRILNNGSPGHSRTEQSFLLEGDIRRKSVLQQKLAPFLKSSAVHITLQVSPAMALVSVPVGKEADWIETFKAEKAVSHADHDIFSFPKSVEAYVKAVLAAKAQQAKVQRVGKALPAPKEIEFKVELPTADAVIDFVNRFYSANHPRVTLVKSDHDESGEYFEILIEHLKGAVTRPPYWEKLRYSIPIYLASPDTVKIRCILDGQFSAGVGDNVPPDSSFQDMEPTYTRAMQDHVGQFVLALQSALAGGKIQ